MNRKIETGGTKEELIATVRTLRKNNDYERRINANEIKQLKDQLDIANNKLDKIKEYINEIKNTYDVKNSINSTVSLNVILSIIGSD